LIHREANLGGANARAAILRVADLGGADLGGANLNGMNLVGADLNGVNLSRAFLQEANLWGANLVEANLYRAHLVGANLWGADFSGAHLVGANLVGADLSRADLRGADLRGADLRWARLLNAVLVNTNLMGADWLSHLRRIRLGSKTAGAKAVLILGRFTADRKAVLDALREELRKRDYLPILFDFEVPTTRDITETVSLLARMARFVIADLTDPSSIPKELEAIVPHLAVPVQPLLEGASRPYAMFKDYWKYDWVLPVHRYEGLEELLAVLAERVIAPAEAKVKALDQRRRAIEAELLKVRRP
jgi:Pentapeptide repeats (8 copies)